MRVSVIVRTYNRGYIIGEAIANILAQAHQDVEVIVVDDGSKDDTRQIIAGFNSEKVRYIRHDQNRGVAAAANTGDRGRHRRRGRLPRFRRLVGAADARAPG